MIPIELKVDITEMLNVLSPEQANKTHALALNKVVTIARKETKQRIARRKNIKLSDIKLKIRRARSSNLKAFIYGRKKPFSLFRFQKMTKSKKPQTGIMIEVDKGNKMLISGSFINISRITGTPIVITRLGKERYPIDVTQLRNKYSFSLASILTNQDNLSSINFMIQNRAPIILQQTIDDQIKRRLSKIDIEIEPGDE
jgi:hypothetical protein